MPPATVQLASQLSAWPGTRGLTCASGMPSMQFAVRHGGLSLKITLDEKWQARALTTSVIGPFVKSFNKKRPDYEHISEDGLAGVQVDGEAWVDSSQTASKALSPDAKALDLFFDSKEALVTTRSCRVACGETEMRIELATKWLRQPFTAAVIAPFAAAYNKKHASPLVPTPLDPATLCAIAIDDVDVPLSEGGKPTCLVAPRTCKCIDLSFGSLGSGSPSPATAAVSTANGGPSERERLKQLWTRVCATPESVATAREVKWSALRLGQHDGSTVGLALLTASRVPCEGSYGDGLGNLLTLNLQDNDLRDEGLIGLAASGAFDRGILRGLRELYLQNNRIGDRGAAALTNAGLPTLMVLNLQENSIGADGAKSIAHAISTSAFKPRHLNLRENHKLDKNDNAAEELRRTAMHSFVELKMEPRLSAETVMPSMKTQMKALAIS